MPKLVPLMLSVSYYNKWGMDYEWTWECW